MHAPCHSPVAGPGATANSARLRGRGWRPEGRGHSKHKATDFQACALQGVPTRRGVRHWALRRAARQGVDSRCIDEASGLVLLFPSSARRISRGRKLRGKAGRGVEVSRTQPGFDQVSVSAPRRCRRSRSAWRVRWPGAGRAGRGHWQRGQDPLPLRARNRCSRKWQKTPSKASGRVEHVANAVHDARVGEFRPRAGDRHVGVIVSLDPQALLRERQGVAAVATARDQHARVGLEALGKYAYRG